MPISISIVEDNAALGDELVRLLGGASGCVCLGVYRSLEAAFRRIPPLKPDVIIMETKLPDGSGIDAAHEFKRRLPTTQILMFTTHADSEQILKAFEAGASGYLLKRTTRGDLLRAVHEIAAGGGPMTPEVARKVIQMVQHRRLKAGERERLTPREIDILELLSQGLLTKEIAGRLLIGVETVNSHLKNIYGKFRVRTRTEAAIKYLGLMAACRAAGEMEPATVGALRAGYRPAEVR